MMEHPIQRLYASVVEVRDGGGESPRTARLLRDGMGKMAKKVAEEAVEVSLDAVAGNRDALIRESADLIYNLAVLWAASDVLPEEVWAEMRRREELYGMAEKLPKLKPGEVAPITVPLKVVPAA
jgi:phosphoribosyl-ATP pyrophosphohydrolase